MDDELRERGVELLVGERQLLGRRALDRDSRVAFADGVDERLGRIDGRHGFLAEPLDQLRRQRTRSAADVEHAAFRPCEVGEQRRQRHRVPAHEPVVRLGGDGEGHAPNLRDLWQVQAEATGRRFRHERERLELCSSAAEGRIPERKAKQTREEWAVKDSNLRPLERRGETHGSPASPLLTMEGPR